jgi:diguanylate cyclase (GGDEF)-like protein
MRMRTASLHSALHQTDPFELDEEIMRFGGYARDYIAARDKLLGMKISTEEKKLHAALKSAIRISQPKTEAVMVLLTEEASTEAALSALHQAEHSHVKVLELLDQLVTLTKQRVTQAIDKNDTGIARTQNLLLLLSALVILFGTVTVVQVIRRSMAKDRKIAYQATHDSLTLLLNRPEFEKQVSHAIKSAQQSDSTHALLYVDLDQFKVVNNTCGHAAGDELLREITMLLNRDIRKNDVMARLGGDEFGILLGNCSPGPATRIAEQVLDSLGGFRFTWNEKSYKVSASIGIVPITSGTSSSAQALSAADRACYAAKDAGRNRFHLFTEEDSELKERHNEMHWVSYINSALEEKRLEIHCQPILPTNSNSGECNHYEILLRLKERDNQLVPPGNFLPAAEKYGLMNTLDHWVIRETFAYLRRYQDETGHQPGIVCINLSGHSIGDARLLDFIIQELSRPPLQSKGICFEITETAAISNLSRAITFIERLKSFGCRFALDDFGSGLSSFSYLKKLPVDYLKIDGSFVRDMHRDPLDFAMVKSINEIGQTMGIITIAEFVEKSEILEKLRQIGVDFVQGYHMDRPAPIADISAKYWVCNCRELQHKHNVA